MGGFGSAVLEAAADAGLDTSRIRRLGIPDRFVEHGDRASCWRSWGWTRSGIADACRRAGRRRAAPATRCETAES